jgi:Cu/Ag efflux pump CusA
LSLRERLLIGAGDRLNPIVMTALSTALALIPLALNAEVSGNEIQSPMAVVILGGLLSATLLNLYVIPAIYAIVRPRLS